MKTPFVFGKIATDENFATRFRETGKKAALIKNDILDSQSGKLTFQDPIYAYWLKHCYFK